MANSDRGKRRGKSGSVADRGLGESRRIPRRDFLQGTLIAAATTLTGPLLEGCVQAASAAPRAAQDMPGYYPPLLNGMRGSHPGSFEAAHAMRDGKHWDSATDTGESYDLIVAGGGMSGLAAAHFYRAHAGGKSRILILENHDDFGGHAKRNEFQLGGLMQLMNGGTYLIDSPRAYSAVAGGLIRELGIDVAALQPKIERPNFYRDLGLDAGIFFDRETFGTDKLAAGVFRKPYRQVLADSPLPERARADIERIEEGEVDFMPGLSSEEKKQRLSRISYRDFLRQYVKVDPATLAFYQARTHGEWAVGIDAVSALDCWGIGMSGFQGMKLAHGSIARMGYTPAGYADTGGSPRLHFPDGNATIARLLIRNLIPAAIPGHTVEDLVTARANYARLDDPASPVRVRLSSTVVRAVNIGGVSGSKGVEVTYVRGGKAYTVRAPHCVLACWNMVIPYLCPELPEAQKSALHQLVKSPLVYTSVALRDWQAFRRLKVAHIYAPGSYFSRISLNEHVDIGAYRSSRAPSEPILAHMVRCPCKPGLPEHDQNRAGRYELLATSFATFEHNIRDEMARALGPGGFDPARDIAAITVNRWPHGYAPEYNPLWDPELPESQSPNVIGRAPFGRIHIANSDSGRAAYTDSAIDQAHRAVSEILAAT